MVMYETVLDPDLSYSIQVTLLEDGYMDVSQFKLYPGPGDPASGLGAGAIAGIAIGAVAAVGIASALVWYFVVRRKRRQQANDFTIDMESDSGDAVHHTIEPFTDGPSTDTGPAMRSGGQPGPLSSSYQSSGSTSTPLLSSSSRYSGSAPLTVNNPDELGSSASTCKQPYHPSAVRHVDHTDAGAFVPEASEGEDIVTKENPPSYNPDWAQLSIPDGPSSSVPSEVLASDPDHSRGMGASGVSGKGV